jgi:hypothetical protein
MSFRIWSFSFPLFHEHRRAPVVARSVWAEFFFHGRDHVPNQCARMVNLEHCAMTGLLLRLLLKYRDSAHHRPVQQNRLNPPICDVFVAGRGSPYFESGNERSTDTGRVRGTTAWLDAKYRIVTSAPICTSLYPSCTRVGASAGMKCRMVTSSAMSSTSFGPTRTRLNAGLGTLGFALAVAAACAMSESGRFAGANILSCRAAFDFCGDDEAPTGDVGRRS